MKQQLNKDGKRIDKRFFVIEILEHAEYSHRAFREGVFEMKWIKVKAWKDEWYPVYIFDNDRAGKEIEIDEQFLKEYVETSDKFNKMIDIVKDIYDSAT